MASLVSVANLAASKLGEDDQLASFEDDTHLGRSVRAAWDIVRRAALRDHPWNFAMRRVQLAATAAPTAIVSWSTSFPLPADCVRVIEVLGWSRSDFEVEGRAILANAAGPLGLRYVADVEEPALWDDLFVEAFACRLGFQVADRITGDRGRKSDLWQAYQDALSQAKRVDARENPRVEWEPTGWELARTGYGYGWGERVDRNGMVWP